MKHALAILVCSLCLVGCFQFKARDALANGAKGAAEGFATGGPVGAIIGGIVAAVGGGFALKKHRQVKRRERLLSVYQRAHGMLAPDLAQEAMRGHR